MSIEAMKQALEALEKLWDIIDDIDTYGDMAKSDDKLYRSLVERRQRQRFEQTGISTDGYELNGGAITALRQAIEQAEKQKPSLWLAIRKDGRVKYTTDSDRAISWKQSGSHRLVRDYYTAPVIEQVEKQEPFAVAWVLDGELFWPSEYEVISQAGDKAIPLYTATPKREWVGLTDHELQVLDFNDPERGKLARAVEAKLKERNG